MATPQDISKRIQAAKEAGFSDDQIYSTLASNPDFGMRIKKAKNEGFSDSQIAQNLGLGIQKDLGTQKPMVFKAVDPRKEAEKEYAKRLGKPQFWESGLLGLSDLGSGVLQGVSKVADTASSGINKALGTNLDTGSYNRVTQQRKEINDLHNLRRQVNEQGFDWGRLGGQIAGTAPIALTGGGGFLAAAGRGSLVGGGIGAASYAKDSNERFNNTAFGGIGGAAGGALGKLIGMGATKAINAYKNNMQKGAKEIIDQGEKHGVRTSVSDAGQGAITRNAEIATERVPVVGMSGFRQAQQDEAKVAANKVVAALKEKLSEVDYKSLNKIQSAASTGDPNAIRIMKTVNSAGDDSGGILQAAAEIKNWRGSQLASQMYDRVSNIAGNSKISANKTMQTINDVIANDSKTIPNNQLLSELESIKSNWADPANPQNFRELQATKSRLGELVDEWGREGKSTKALSTIRSAIDEDLSTFANNSGKPQLVQEFKRANEFYKQLQTNKDKSFIQSMSSKEPDQIYNMFVKAGKGDKAANFYKNLDQKGQSALRYEMARVALDKATVGVKDGFSPAKFAQEFERMREPYGEIFSGADKAQMDGFVKLMRHIERAGQYAENNPNGMRVTDSAMWVGAVLNPALAAKVAASTAFAKTLFTTNAGKRILLAAKELPPGSEGLSNLLKMAEKLSTTTGSNLTKSNQ
ncbi:hypothetical protein [Acinetobacter higginsii]|uniref:hypothetical protein n=1 Tax=Acinetobacter higginsii TaxID=70347 RepID=UPI001F4B72AF|nr:hypothetical protein [Acinetobacter higginsii]MCH7295476.1 hypothetical protein [Acinetobacter higginsii]